MSADPATETEEWASVVQSHRGWLEGVFSRRLGCRGPVGDLVQETLCAALVSGSPAGGVREARAWLGGIARNKLRKHFERESRDRRLRERVLRDDAAGEAGPSPSDWVLRAERVELASLALARLEEEDARLLRGKYYRLWSYERIGRELGLNADAVTNGLRRARRNFRAHLERLQHERDSILEKP